MSLIGFLILCAVVGVACYLLTLLPMPAPIRTVIVAVAVLGLLVTALRVFGGNLGVGPL